MYIFNSSSPLVVLWGSLTGLLALVPHLIIIRIHIICGRRRRIRREEQELFRIPVHSRLQCFVVRTNVYTLNDLTWVATTAGWLGWLACVWRGGLPFKKKGVSISILHLLWRRWRRRRRRSRVDILLFVSFRFDFSCNSHGTTCKTDSRIDRQRVDDCVRSGYKVHRGMVAGVDLLTLPVF